MTKCPVKVRQAGFVLEEKETEFLTADYGSHFFVQITQVGKVGRLILASRDKPNEVEGHSTFSITNLLGLEDERVDLLARQIVEKLNISPPYKPLLLSYSCKTHPPLQTLVKILSDLGITS